MQLKRSPGQKTEVALKIELDIASVVEVYQVKDNKRLRLNGSNKSRKIQQHKFTLIGKTHAPFRKSCALIRPTVLQKLMIHVENGSRFLRGKCPSMYGLH